MTKPSCLYRRRSDVDLREVGEEAFLIDASSGRIHHLNATAAALWRMLMEPRRLADMVEAFGEAFPEISRRTLKKRLRALLSELQENDLLIAAGPGGVRPSAQRSRSSARRTGRLVRR